MESIHITEWLQQRITEVNNTIETYDKCCQSMSETISVNTPKFMSMDEVDNNEKESAEKRFNIYRNVINDILIPTKNNYLQLLKSFNEDVS